MPNKLQFKLEIFFYYFKKNFLYLTTFIVAATSVYIYHQQLISYLSKIIPSKELIGIEGFYTTENLPDIVSQQISYGITEITENNKTSLSPIVESITTQNDNLDYIVTLKPNLYWHNGKKLLASDIDLQINGLDITPINDNQLKISTTNLYAPLLSLLSRPILTKNLVGLGSYKVYSVSYRDGFIKKLILKSTQDGHPDKIYNFYPSENDLINAYKLREINTAYGLSTKSDFDNWTKIKITPEIQSSQKYIAIFLNTEKLQSKQLRQALAYATPKSKDRNERCLGPISPNSWAYNSAIKEYTMNPTKAKEFFENNKIESINLTVSDRRLLSQAENIKNTWHEILDINVTLSIESRIDPNNYEAVISYAGIPIDPDQYSFWHSTQTSTNITHLNNSRIDKLLEDGRQTVDALERKEIYYEFQRYLLEESPAIFLSYPTIYNITKIN